MERLAVGFMKQYMLDVAPLPDCNRDHQDDMKQFQATGDPNLNLHLLMLLGGSHTQNIC